MITEINFFLFEELNFRNTYILVRVNIQYDSNWLKLNWTVFCMNSLFKIFILHILLIEFKILKTKSKNKKRFFRVLVIFIYPILKIIEIKSQDS